MFNGTPPAEFERSCYRQTVPALARSSIDRVSKKRGAVHEPQVSKETLPHDVA